MGPTRSRSRAPWPDGLNCFAHAARFSLAGAVAPAIRFRADGHAVSDIVAEHWERTAARISADATAAQVLLPGGRAPRAGEILPQSGAGDEPRDDRRRRRARDVRRHAAENDRGRHHAARRVPGRGRLRRAHLGLGRSDRHDVSRYTVYEMPPNSQGFVALEMLNILEGYDVAAMGHNSADYLHVLTEAKRIAFADRAPTWPTRARAGDRAADAALQGIRVRSAQPDRPAQGRSVRTGPACRSLTVIWGTRVPRRR